MYGPSGPGRERTGEHLGGDDWCGALHRCKLGLRGIEISNAAHGQCRLPALFEVQQICTGRLIRIAS